VKKENKHDGIEVELQGGLGNQLFGWACGFSTARRLSLDLHLDISRLTQHGFQLEEINHGANIINNSGRKLKKAYRITSDRIFQEYSFMYDERINFQKRGIILKGYFQSWKYFHADAHEVKSIVRSKKVLSLNALELQTILEKSKFNIVHVRRGDYKNLQQYHGLTTVNYYKKAKTLLEKLDKNNQYMVFSDDIEIAKEIWPNAAFYISPNVILSPIENLILMSKCENFIGSNSSFSWWASYINPGDGLRIFPRPWFSSTNHDTRDLLVPGWLTIGNDPID
jgi:hypothetical protein